MRHKNINFYLYQALRGCSGRTKQSANNYKGELAFCTLSTLKAATLNQHSGKWLGKSGLW